RSYVQRSTRVLPTVLTAPLAPRALTGALSTSRVSGSPHLATTCAATIPTSTIAVPQRSTSSAHAWTAVASVNTVATTFRENIPRPFPNRGAPRRRVLHVEG